MNWMNGKREVLIFVWKWIFFDLEFVVEINYLFQMVCFFVEMHFNYFFYYFSKWFEFFFFFLLFFLHIYYFLIFFIYITPLCWFTNFSECFPCKKRKKENFFKVIIFSKTKNFLKSPPNQMLHLNISYLNVWVFLIQKILKGKKKSLQK